MAAVMFEGELEVRDCIVANNGAAHGAITGEGDLRVVDTVFSDNQGGTDAADVGSIQFGQGTLHVEGCVFERQSYGLIRTAGTEFVFRNNVVRENDSADLLVQTLGADPVHAVVDGNLFLDNGRVSIDEQLWIPNPSITMEVRGNTFVRSSLDVTLGAGWILENNVHFGADRGVNVWGADPGYVVRCNNAWGNGQNWEGIPDPTGTDGNVSADPLFCDAAAGRVPDAGVGDESAVPVDPSDLATVEPSDQGLGRRAQPLQHRVRGKGAVVVKRPLTQKN